MPPMPLLRATPRSLGLVPALMVLLALGALTLGGCGKKGDPEPPILLVPAASQDLTLSQRGEELILSFSYPKTTAAGTPLPGLTGIEVDRLITPFLPGPTPPETPDLRQFGPAAEAVLVVEGEALPTTVQGDRVVLRVPMPQAEDLPAPTSPTSPDDGAEDGEGDGDGDGDGEDSGTAVAPPLTTEPSYLATFGVRTRADAGERFARSNLVAVEIAPAPAAPRDLATEPRPGGVLVTWSYPEGDTAADTTTDTTTDPEDASEATDEAGKELGEATGEEAAEEQVDEPADEPEPGAEEDDGSGFVGFNLYRRASSERLWGPPIRRLGPAARQYVDRSARLGQRYIYSVTAVKSRQPVQVESAIPAEVEILFRDTFAPPIPTDLVALGEDGRVRLIWSQVEDDDLAGYRIYRQGPGEGGEFVLVNEDALVTDNQLTDSGLTADQRYTYRVSAVDGAGNESRRSRPAAAVPR